jgi:protoheme IX farnesyltransferase
MARTSWRATARGDISPLETVTLATALGAVGLWLLHSLINDLTMWLTLATFVGYTVIYTLILKPATPMNIVIGGASGAMPPLLGWTAMTGQVSAEPLVLFLIIFLWTPPHFWALACYRRDDYARSGLPMLPVTHGNKYTRLHVLLYTIILFACSLLPYVYGMSGVIYAVSALALSTAFIVYAVRLYLRYSDALARRTFRFSILYLSLLFAALLVDHYFRF